MNGKGNEYNMQPKELDKEEVKIEIQSVFLRMMHEKGILTDDIHLLAMDRIRKGGVTYGK